MGHMGLPFLGLSVYITLNPRPVSTYSLKDPQPHPLPKHTQLKAKLPNSNYKNTFNNSQRTMQ